MSVAAKAKAPKRVRLVSVSTLLDAILPKPGLIHWAERETVKGVATLVRAGEPVDRMTDDDILAALRESQIGAEGTRDVAARRGINVHAMLETYLRTGKLPDPVGLLDPEDYGYWRALDRWLMATNPEPLMIEEIVCDPAAGYAGRLDAIVGRQADGRTVLWDLKTSERAQAYDSAHLQTRLYARTLPLHGDPLPDEVRIVVAAKDGEYRDIPCLADEQAAETALRYWRTIKPITAACTSANRAEKEARTAPADRAPAVEWESAPDHPDPARRPGALEVYKRRELRDGGLLEFESAPVGWTTKDGKRRQRPWRAYLWTPPAQGELAVAA